MRRFLIGSLLALLAVVLPLPAHAACTNTTWLALCKPAEGDLDWDTSLNVNFDTIDSLAQGTKANQAVGMKAQGAVLAAPAAGEVKYSTDHSADRGLGTATADCALLARLSNGTEIAIDILVVDGPCP